MEKIAPFDKQAEAFQIADKNLITLYGGAIRGGKSYWGCLALFTYSFEYPNSRWLILRENLPTIKRNLLPTINNILQSGFQHFVKNFDYQTFTLTWTNGSQIIIMSESYDTDKELNRFRGLEINGAFIDEINEIQQQTFNKIIERSGTWFHSPGCPTKILASCNPTNSWVKDIFYEPYKLGTLKEGMAYVPARIYDNPHIPKAYFDSLKMLPKYQYEVFVEGNWDLQLKVGGEFYKCFELDQHVKDFGKDNGYKPELPLHISWDDNVNPYLPCGIFQIEGKEIRMIDEIAGVTPNNTVERVCKEIIRRYQGHNAGMFIYGDATANKEDTKLEKGMNFYKLILQHLAQYKPVNRVLTSNPSVVMRGNWINTVLEKELGGIRIIFGANCKKAISDMVVVKEASDGTKLKETETTSSGVKQQKNSHFSDLTDYVLCAAFNAEFKLYQQGGLSAPVLSARNPVSKNAY